VSKKKPHFVRRLSVFLGVLAASKLKVSRHKKKILAGRLGLDPLFGVSVCGAPRFLAGMVGGDEECL
jgi:hypothetical protein